MRSDHVPATSRVASNAATSASLKYADPPKITNFSTAAGSLDAWITALIAPSDQPRSA